MKLCPPDKKRTDWRKRHLAVAAALGVGVAFAAHGAAFDLNRVFGVGKDLVTATTGIDEKQEIA